MGSGNHRIDHFASDIRQAEIPPAKVIGKLLVIDAHEVENGGVYVMHRSTIDGGMVSYLVCFTIACLLYTSPSPRD